jgi:hypothetical protein
VFVIVLTQSSVAEAEETAVRAVDDRVDDVSQGTRAHFALQTNMSHLITKIKRESAVLDNGTGRESTCFFAIQKIAAAVSVVMLQDGNEQICTMVLDKCEPWAFFSD